MSDQCPLCNGTGKMTSRRAQFENIETLTLLKIITDFCLRFNIENKVKPEMLDYIVSQFQSSFHLGREIRKVLVWIKDNDKKMVTSARIQNWFSKAHEAAQKARKDARIRPIEQSEPKPGQQRRIREVTLEELPDVHREMIEEKKSKVESDPRLQEFLAKTATDKSMPEPTYRDLVSSQ